MLVDEYRVLALWVDSNDTICLQSNFNVLLEGNDLEFTCTISPTSYYKSKERRSRQLTLSTASNKILNSLLLETVF